MKRFLINLRRISKAGLQNFIRNSWLSTAATAIMVVTLTIVLGTFVANMTFSRMIKSITDKIDVSVYLNDEVTKDEREQLEQEFKELPSVAGVEYVSKEQALQDYQEQNKNDLDLLNAISLAINPLPASLRVQPHDPNRLDDITGVISREENQPLIFKVSYSGDRKQAIDRIVSIARFFRVAGVVSSIIFAIISILIIFNTIRMAIFNRRDEIEIMKLIGATRGYIRGPFLIEASLYGIIAGTVTLLFIYTLILGQSSNIASYIPEVVHTEAFFRDNILVVAAGTITLGVLIGVISSLLATHRYLKMYSQTVRKRRIGRNKA